MIGKHVAQLERSLGARLLNRTSRHLSLTEAGKAWYAQSSQALDLLDAAEAAQLHLPWRRKLGGPGDAEPAQ